VKFDGNGRCADRLWQASSHELAFPYEVLASIVRALKPGGQLVVFSKRADIGEAT
jgi:predicted methyltransferase